MLDGYLKEFLAPLFNTMQAGPYVRRTPREVLFNGQDALLQYIGQPSSIGIRRNHSSYDHAREIQGWNTIRTGRDDIGRVRTYTEWRNFTAVPGWDPPEPVSGFDGFQFPPGYIDDVQLIRAWPGDAIFRLASLSYIEDEDILGITTRKHVLSSSFLASSSDNPANARYFQEYTGLLNLTAYLSGTPLFTSLPRFNLVASEIQDHVSGMTADPDEDRASLS